MPLAPGDPFLSRHVAAGADSVEAGSGQHLAHCIGLFKAVIQTSSQQATRHPEEVMRDLMASQQSILLQMKELEQFVTLPESNGPPE